MISKPAPTSERRTRQPIGLPPRGYWPLSQMVCHGAAYYAKALIMAMLICKKFFGILFGQLITTESLHGKGHSSAS